MPILEISVLPVGTPTSSISSYITDACKILEQRGLEYQVTPTCTVVEGELDQLLDVAREMHQAPFANGVNRVVTSMTIDHRQDRPMDLKKQVQSVTQELKM